MSRFDSYKTGRLLYWIVAIGILLPVFMFMYCNVLFFFIFLVGYITGLIPPNWFAKAVMAVSAGLSLWSLIALWRPFSKRVAEKSKLKTGDG